MTPDVMKRWRRISNAKASGRVWDVQALFNGLSEEFSPETAVDLFEHILEMHRGKNPAPKQIGRPAGDHDADRDRLLLSIFDEKDPKSFLSLARRGELKLNSDSPRRYTMRDLAETLSRHGYWGATSPEQILRRLKHLRKKHRTK